MNTETGETKRSEREQGERVERKVREVREDTRHRLARERERKWGDREKIERRGREKL